MQLTLTLLNLPSLEYPPRGWGLPWRFHQRFVIFFHPAPVLSVGQPCAWMPAAAFTLPSCGRYLSTRQYHSIAGTLMRGRGEEGLNYSSVQVFYTGFIVFK